jgi:2-polyprenyl-3-methyl-5-hydroxy-6-metoxy-1,4-benzoquinol methylase
MIRSVKPELLDQLSPTHPLAAGSREDLKRVNAWMANASLIANEINTLAKKPKRWLELGAGDGTLLLNVLSKTRLQPDREVTLLDQQNLLSEQTRGRYARFGAVVRAQQQDVLNWSREPASERYDVIVCNLFLHHFREPELKQIFAKISRDTDFFVACEPRRTRAAVLATRFLWLIGCSQVTRHDAQVSVEAGFAEDELAGLWPNPSAWVLEDKSGGFASHIFTARRADG